MDRAAAPPASPPRTRPTPPPVRVALLTAVTLAFFAANSLLARAALGPGLVDAASFTTLRLASGAAALLLLSRATGRGHLRGGRPGAGLVLFAYAICFSLAYRRVAAGTGAFLLFAAVQATMVGWSVAQGARPTRPQWAGLVLALAGLAWLTLPGAHAPDPGGAALMLAAGIGWGAYTLLARGAGDPVAATAAGFVRSLPAALAASILSTATLHVTPAGVALAATSGAVTSGIGYVLWYGVVPALGATRAAAVQLAVPAIVPLAAAGLLGEPLTLRLFLSGTAILGGVALAIAPPRRGPPRTRTDRKP